MTVTMSMSASGSENSYVRVTVVVPPPHPTVLQPEERLKLEIAGVSDGGAKIIEPDPQLKSTTVKLITTVINSALNDAYPFQFSIKAALMAFFLPNTAPRRIISFY